MIDGVTHLRSMICALYVPCTSDMVVHYHVVCVYAVIVIPCGFLLLSFNLYLDIRRRQRG